MKFDRYPREEPIRSYPTYIETSSGYSSHKHLLASGIGGVLNKAIKESGSKIVKVVIRPPAGLNHVDLRRL